MRENRTIRDKRAWEPIVILFRKLREGIYATHWSNKNYIFAIKGMYYLIALTVQ